MLGSLTAVVKYTVTSTPSVPVARSWMLWVYARSVPATAQTQRNLPNTRDELAKIALHVGLQYTSYAKQQKSLTKWTQKSELNRLVAVMLILFLSVYVFHSYGMYLLDIFCFFNFIVYFRTIFVINKINSTISRRHYLTVYIRYWA